MQQIIYNGITIICAVYLAFVYVAYLNITLDKSNKKRKPLWLFFCIIRFCIAKWDGTNT